MADLAPAGRPVRTVAGSWTSRAVPVPIGGEVAMGSLGADGGGPLRITRPSTLLVSGRVFLRHQGVGSGDPSCQLHIDDVPVGVPSYGNFTAENGAHVALAARQRESWQP